MTEVDVLVGDPIHIDPSVFAHWYRGLSVNDAVHAREKSLPVGDAFTSTPLLTSDTSDQYFTFNMLERYLISPTSLDQQSLIALSPSTEQMLLDGYYSLEDNVVREFLGKKLSSRLRRDLDDVAEKTQVPLKSCRRQFDNIRRVYKLVEDMPGILMDNIRRHFLLSMPLAKKYCTVVFMTAFKFETGKKRLAHVGFPAFVVCATEMIENWTVSGADYSCTDLDRAFLKELADVRTILESETDNQRSLVSHALVGQILDSHLHNLEGSFKHLNKSLLKIGEGLVHKTELKDFFSDLVEKVVEPCRQLELRPDEVDCLLVAILATASQLENLQRRPRYAQAYRRYMTTVRICILHLYRS